MFISDPVRYNNKDIERGAAAMAFRRILAVGDVHGYVDKLRMLWKKIAFDDQQDLLIFLGDYIDRGAAPVDALRFVREQVERYENVHALCGNHEAMMLAYLKQYGRGRTFLGHFDIWLMNGGKVTKKQLDVLPEAESEELIAFVKARPLYHRVQRDGQSVLFVHAGVNPARKKQTSQDLLWIRDSFFDNYRGAELVVVGHTPTQALDGRNVPLFLPNNIIACDTGSFLPDGRISCVDVARYLKLRAQGRELTAEELASCYLQSA